MSIYSSCKALIIGVGSYADPQYDLSYARSDAEAMAELLENEFGFDQVWTLYDNDATKQNIRRFFERDLQQVDEDDGLLIFFAGHGITVTSAIGDERGFLVPHDGDPKQPYDNISLASIRDDYLPMIPAKHVFLIVDSCYGGLALRDVATVERPQNIDEAVLAELTRRDRKVRQVLAAGSRDQRVLDGGLFGHSVFTGRLIEALHEASPYITADHVGVHVRERVARDSMDRKHRQTPQFGYVHGYNGSFVFSRLGQGMKSQSKWLGIVDRKFAPSGNTIEELANHCNPVVTGDEKPAPDSVDQSQLVGQTGNSKSGRTGDGQRKSKRHQAKAKKQRSRQSRQGEREAILLAAREIVSRAMNIFAACDKTGRDPWDEIESICRHHFDVLKATASDLPYVAYLLGEAYHCGWGCEESEKEEAKWLYAAAEADVPEAQCSLGGNLRRGYPGFPKDEVAAFEWFLRAAELGDAGGQNMVANCYRDGLGCKRDEEKAFQWYRKAAESGYHTAQNNLAECYRDGIGVRRDRVEAQKWHERAMSAQNPTWVGVAERSWREKR